jgi:hypothetical protein
MREEGEEAGRGEGERGRGGEEVGGKAGVD